MKSVKKGVSFLLLFSNFKLQSSTELRSHDSAVLRGARRKTCSVIFFLFALGRSEE